MRYRVVAAGLAVGLVGGTIALVATPPLYASSATVLVTPSDQTLATEARLVTATSVLNDVAGRLGVGVRLPSVQLVPDSDILIITYRAASPTEAQAGAQAFAEVYLASLARQAEATKTAQLANLDAQLGSVDNELTELATAIDRLPANSADEPGMRARLASLSDQATDLTTRQGQLTATQIDVGRVIRDADLPRHRVSPDPWRYLGVSAAIGLVLGFVAMFVRRALVRRVRGGLDLPDIALLGTVPAGVLAPAYDRLRNEIVGMLGPRDQVLLVTGASPGTASTLVAANLAAALARAGTDVVLVGTNVAEFGTTEVTLARLFDVAAIPGFTDAVTGRTTIDRALQRAARNPRLRVATPGGAASASGLLQTAGVRAIIGHLRLLTEYVLVEAPSTADGADAQSLAGAADVAIIAVQAGVTSPGQVSDAATQLRRVGTRVLGAIIVDPALTAPQEPAPTATVWVNPRREIDPPTALLPAQPAVPRPS